ncbi:integrase core domain-containing protein [Solimonas flava]|uniref:integrase core domain-containing protein n=1 Tax=Solimonas flava TaxID=415849 RepID=UPI003450CE3F
MPAGRSCSGSRTTIAACRPEPLVDERRAATGAFWNARWHGLPSTGACRASHDRQRRNPSLQAAPAAGIRHVFTKPCTPRSSGEAERFVPTALLEWADAGAYARRAERTARLTHWRHHYSHHRRHSTLGCKPPISRLPGR